MIYVRGTLWGLAMFGAWVTAIVAILVAAYYIEYWLWVIFPASFIAFGITLSKDRARSQSNKVSKPNEKDISIESS